MQAGQVELRSAPANRANAIAKPRVTTPPLTLLARLGGTLPSKAARCIAARLGGSQRVLLMLSHTLGVALHSGKGSQASQWWFAAPPSPKALGPQQRLQIV